MYSTKAAVFLLLLSCAVLFFTTVHAEPVNCPGTITESDSGAVLCNGELVREGDDSIGGAVTQTITSSAHGYAGHFFMTVATMLLMMVIGHQ